MVAPRARVRRARLPASARLTAAEEARLRALRTPAGIQRWLDAVPYHHARTVWSPRRVLRERTAHCLEAAIFAAAALWALGCPPLLLDLEAVHDTDHVLAVFRIRRRWGAIAKSNFSSLRYRDPVYRTVRELVMSYFDSYINLRGERTLRAYSRPVSLSRFDRTRPGWMVSEADLWFIPEHLAAIPHTPVVTPAMARALSRVDRRSFTAALIGHEPH